MALHRAYKKKQTKSFLITILQAIKGICYTKLKAMKFYRKDFHILGFYY